jgi:type II secretory pathway pseudopilin PulG
VTSSRCLVIRAQMGRYVDEVLADHAARAVREHLDTCHSCVEAERIARAIPTMLTDTIDPLPPEALLPRIMSSVDRARRQERRAALMVATVMLLAAGGSVAGARSVLVSEGARPATFGAGVRAPTVSETQLPAAGRGTQRWSESGNAVQGQANASPLAAGAPPAGTGVLISAAPAVTSAAGYKGAPARPNPFSRPTSAATTCASGGRAQLGRTERSSVVSSGQTPALAGLPGCWPGQPGPVPIPAPSPKS